MLQLKLYKIFGELYKVGSSIAFAIPIFVNFIISKRFDLETASIWLVYFSYMSWARLVLSARSSDIILRFGALNSKNSLSNLLIYVMRRELIFSIAQVSLLWILIHSLVPEFFLSLLIFTTIYLLLNNIRDISFSCIRIKYGASAFYFCLWCDGLVRIGFIVATLALSPSLETLFLAILGPMSWYLVVIYVGRSSHGITEPLDFEPVKKFANISLTGGILKAGYQNVDLIIAPTLLSAVDLWVYLTGRQLVIQSLNLGTLPIINSHIPVLVSKCRAESNAAVLVWLKQARIYIFTWSIALNCLLALLFFAWMISVDQQILQHAFLIGLLFCIGMVRVNLWWNKEFCYFIDKFFVLKVSAAGLFCSSIGVLVGWFTASFNAFACFYLGAFLCSLVAAEVLVKRLGNGCES